jgi:hypothetical protein
LDQATFAVFGRSNQMYRKVLLRPAHNALDWLKECKIVGYYAFANTVVKRVRGP